MSDELDQDTGSAISDTFAPATARRGALLYVTMVREEAGGEIRTLANCEHNRDRVCDRCARDLGLETLTKQAHGGTSWWESNKKGTSAAFGE